MANITFTMKIWRGRRGEWEEGRKEKEKVRNNEVSSPNIIVHV